MICRELIPYPTQPIGLDGPNVGTVYSKGTVPYDPVNKVAMLGTGGIGTVTSAHFPTNVQNKIKMTFIVKDKVGNTSSSDLVFYDNSKCSENATLVAIEDPTYSGSYLGQISICRFSRSAGCVQPQ